MTYHDPVTNLHLSAATLAWNEAGRPNLSRLRVRAYPIEHPYKARAGEIREFTGIDAPYEAPEDPEIVVHTDRQTVDESVATILEQLLPRLREYEAND